MNADPVHSLDDVLAEIAAAPAPPDGPTLRALTEKYPAFKSDIIEFATDWVAMEAARSTHEVTAEDIDLVVNRTMSRVQALLDHDDRPVTVRDLIADIHAAGHDIDSFERAIGIDRSIVNCLIGRLIKPATLPARLVTAMAEALNQSIEAVREYLRLPPQRVTAYRAHKRPEFKQADFAMVVQHSNLPEPEKAKWLAEAPDPKLKG